MQPHGRIEDFTEESKTEMTEKTAIKISQGFDGQTQIEVRLKDETIWLSQAQMAELFDKDVRTIK
jgi:hypothetical protein